MRSRKIRQITNTALKIEKMIASLPVSISQSEYNSIATSLSKLTQFTKTTLSTLKNHTHSPSKKSSLSLDKQDNFEYW
jgi:hypothetical protein